MADSKIPETGERRQKETGIIGHVMETLIGKQSRKVAFGIWVFIVANGMREQHADMPWDLWWKCVLLAGALIGLGTVLDDIVATFGNKLANAAADKVTSIVSTTEKKTDTTVVTQ